MRLSTFRFVGLGVLAAVLLVWPASVEAQKGDSEPPAKKAAAGQVLTTETLGELLENMGYEAKPVTLPDGYKLFGVSASQESWRFYVEVSIPRAGTQIAFLAPLTKFDEQSGNKLPAPMMRKMLQTNWNLLPNALVLHPEQQRLYLIRFMDNRDITASRLRAVLEDVFATIRRTHDVWNPEKWGTAQEDAGKAADTKEPTTDADATPALSDAVKKLLAAAKADDQAAVASQVKKLMLPDPEAWFQQVFGKAVGAALAEDYADTRQQTEAGLVRMLLTAAEEGQNQVQVLRFTKPDPDRATGNQNKALDQMKVKVPLYSVRLVKAGEEAGAHLYSFASVDGAIRFVGKMRGLADRAPRELIPPTSLPSGAIPGEPIVPQSGFDVGVEEMFRQLARDRRAIPHVALSPSFGFDGQTPETSALGPNSMSGLMTGGARRAGWAAGEGFPSALLPAPLSLVPGRQGFQPAESGNGIPTLKNLLPPMSQNGFAPAFARPKAP